MNLSEKLAGLPHDDQQKLVVEFLSTRPEFLQFLENKYPDFASNNFRPKDLVYSDKGLLLMVIHHLSNGHAYCQFMGHNFLSISREEYESGIVELFIDYDLWEYDREDDYAERPESYNLKNLKKFESFHLWSGYERFQNGKIKKTLSYYASVLDKRPPCFTVAEWKIGSFELK